MDQPNPIFMRRAIELARMGMLSGAGGPFGAVVVRAGEIIGEGWNRVVETNDPTAHGEISAIRDACQRIGSFQLDGCEIHTTGEPCPMCLGAIHWARIRRIHYGFSMSDAARIGFDDQKFFEEFTRPAADRTIPATSLIAEEARKLIDEYAALPAKTSY